ncbi:aldehyde dehydrogenase family protein [Bradyrhizobium sp. U87765 SZCCT0131]|uniref:aldehyde dehydrogenase family protein n=1 Tax=unclassified Bradyrhizobium TaxID=2631580 RepID=UPI001BAA7BD2|nr:MULTISPECIES: aldehyde dehydrogenase family protein [unclassified Bradyrhizobium]MBR1218337.1 aldehyde dehydrogenase family protein [Bradyrhizobium sp. U87765 SZCCT0131]MBR1260717.1 aldehyde dehydrogenase family protein [Bradyrhizobium sp. U87765 SZCCT0134]MBR1303835.1 aldehyde dehydrogenase family protein [Bradyrhizobium sp. U87765 SZCCT0110]MBR1319441.1 aldehyde dehydrogenase family protein [Bradyrhizobium sp. U87765 SZCCT0109]MBR1347766.1 aldehyde dehydrogenase family protein [Bradyrhizo
MERYALVIDGKTVQAADHFEVLNPSTGAVAGLAPKASREQLDDAIEAAAKAQKAWAKRPDAERKQLCHAVADKIKDNAEELARLLTIEQGKPLNGLGSRFELGGAQAWAHYTADLDIPVKVLQDNNEGRIELHRKPVGVVGSITPWNWPLMIAIWHIIPAIRAGNTVVNKPSPFTPLSTLRMIELMQEVLPPGVVSCVAGEDFLGAHMSGHQGIGKITFTGSSATGQKVMSSASNTLKRLTLELGGNDAGIVLPDVDPQQIAEGLFWGAFINNGQTCAALKRLYVHDNVYDEICNSLATYAKNIPVGDGLDEKSVLGPIQNRMQRDKVARLVEAAKTAGGRVLLGGTADKDDSLFFPLTLISDLDNGNPLVDEEQFGPALPIIRYSDIDDVIARANDNPNGLGGSVWSKDTARAKEIALQLECGSAWINKHGAIQPNAPFGGVKGSGVGVEFGEEGLFENTDIQVIHS